MSAPTHPTEEEVASANFRWEYDQSHISRDRFGEPPGSIPPIITIRRRIVSNWETYNPDKEQS